MKNNLFILFLLILVAFSFKNPQKNKISVSEGWIELINGKDFRGWKASENTDTWSVVDGMFQAVGKRSHLFYVGEELKGGFKNFEIEVQVKTFKLANSGIYFHTEYQESGWPNKGIEIQVNNSHVGEGDYLELKKMASLYGIRNIYKTFAKDDEWMTVKARVESNRVQVWLNGLKTVDYIQPEQTFSAIKRLSQGTFCLQGHDALSKMQYKSFKVRRLADDAHTTLPAPKFGTWQDTLVVFQGQQFAFIDLNPKTEISANDLANYVYASGINVALVKSPAKAKELNTANNLPIFKGIKINQADFKNRLENSVDYIIGESNDLASAQALLMTNKIQIWSDKGKILNSQNAEELLRLANQNSVAIEIDNESKSPSLEVIKLAKAKGLKFTFSGLIPASRMENSPYIFEAIKEAKLTYKDLYIPKW